MRYEHLPNGFDRAAIADAPRSARLLAAYLDELTPEADAWTSSLKRKRAVNENLTLDDFDWLRQLRAATDAKRAAPPVPAAVADKLREFGCVTRNALGGLAITDRGRGALLEQRMRDAEER